MKKGWYDDESFWETIAPLFLTSDKRRQKALTEVDQLLAWLELSPEATVLDFCCGTGRHTIELARRGLKVTGVDRTEEYLTEARKKATAENLAIEFVQEDARTFCRPNAFECVILINSAFGYFDSPEENRQVLLNAYASLKENGWLVLKMIGKELVLPVYFKNEREEQSWYVENEGILVKEEIKVCDNWTWLERTITATKEPEGQKRQYKWSNRLYSATELATILEGFGYRNIKFYGSFDGKPYDHHAKILLVLAKK
jgi:SAM-dependent methyltransferase